VEVIGITCSFGVVRPIQIASKVNTRAAGVALLLVLQAGCGPTTTVHTPKPVIVPVGKDELVIRSTTTTKKEWYPLFGFLPIFPQYTSTTTYDIGYVMRSGLRKKHEVPIHASASNTRPPGTPPAAHRFVEFDESPSHRTLDLYVASDALTAEQYRALVDAIRGNMVRVTEALGQPLASIRHSVWKWDS
jgi:hypothetical protein